MRINKKRQRVLAVALVTISGTALQWEAGAATRNWNISGSGFWVTATNNQWSNNSVPANGDTVNISNNGGTNEVITYNNANGSTVTLGPVNVDGAGGFTNSLLMSSTPAYTLTTAGQMTVGLTGSAVFNQAAGSVNITQGNALVLGFNTGGRGTYDLAGSANLAVSANETIGWSGTGVVNQISGVHIMNNGGGAMFMAFSGASSAGTYNLSAGNLNIIGGDSNGISQYAGYAGVGTVNVNAGIASTGKGLAIGYLNTSTGSSYTLNGSAGSLSVGGSEYVGYGAAGSTSGDTILSYAASFNQSAGTHSVAGAFYVGYGSGSTGVYTLSGTGTLTVGPTSSIGQFEYIGYSGSGTFNQTGGTNTLGSSTALQTLVVGGGAGTVGYYNMNNATGTSILNSYKESIGGAYAGPNGDGFFVQGAGTNNVQGILSIGNTGGTGSYVFAGGTLNVSTNSVTASNAEMVGYAGTGIFNQTGGTHVVGSESVGQLLDLGESNTSTGSFLLSGPAVASTLTVYGNERVGLASTGTVNAAGGVIAYGSIFNQSGGTHNVTGLLSIGTNPGSTGQYILSAGNLSAGSVLTAYGTAPNQSFLGSNEVVGDRGTGNFVQVGGTHTVGASVASYGLGFATSGDLVIGNAAGSTGTYLLTASGILNAYGNEDIGFSTTGSNGNPGGTFIQSGGTNFLGGLVNVGVGGYGLYNMSSGTLASGGLTLGLGGTGVFLQSGGAASFVQVSEPAGYVQLAPNFMIANQAGTVGTYNLSGTASMVVNGSATVGAAGLGTINQLSTNSSANFNQGMILGTGSLANPSSGRGIYNLSAGNLNVSTGITDAGQTLSVPDEVIGSATVGIVNQTGGNHTIGSSVIGYLLPQVSGNSLVLGSDSSASGSYFLSNSSGPATLSLYGDAIVAESATGSNGSPGGLFVQNAGTSALIGGALRVGQNAGSVGQFNLNGGTLQSGGLCLGQAGLGIIAQSGGTAVFYLQTVPVGYLQYDPEFTIGSNLGSKGIYNLTGTGVLQVNNGLSGQSADIGYEGQGLVNEGSANASATFTGTLNLGGGPASDSHGIGAYNLSAGLLTVSAQANVGYLGTGSINQTGGSANFSGNVTVGAMAGSTGCYTLSNTGTVNTLSETIGGGGAGTFIQSGGINNVTSALTIGTTGNYVFTAGVINLSSLVLTAGVPAFNWTGGTLNFTSAISVDTGFALTSNVSLSGTMVLSSNVSITNSGGIALAGGGLTSSGPIVNTGLISGFGTINASGGFTNSTELQQGSGILTLSSSGADINNGNIDLAPGRSFVIQGAALSNTGTLNINGAIVGGTGALVNANGGTVAGRGKITTAFINGAGATLIPQSGTLNVPAFNNSGLIAVTAGATLSGGAINNLGLLQGAGTVLNDVANTGTVEAVGGILSLNGLVTNTGAGIIRLDSGSITNAGGFTSNTAVVQLEGGVLDTLNHPLVNTGTIQGFGNLRTGLMTNNGTVSLAGGPATIDGPVNNSFGQLISVTNTPALFTSPVNNAGTFNISNTTATFLAGYSGTGHYNSDPSINRFTGAVAILAGGTMGGTSADSFAFSGGTFNNAGSFIDPGPLQSSDSTINSGMFDVSGPQSWAAGTTFTNTAGNARFATDAGANGSNLSVTAIGGSITFTSSQHLAVLNVGTGAVVQITGGGTGHRSMVFADSISVAGRLDLTANDLDLQGGGAAGLGSITGLVLQGFHNGSWTGNGIISSAAAGDPEHLTAIGVRLITVNGMLDEESVAAGDVIAKETYFGDANLDGTVNSGDYSLIDNGYLSGDALSGWFNGDFNYDGVINGSDYTLIDNAFNRQGANLSSEIAVIASEMPAASIVPEPACLGLFVAGAASLCRRRRVR